MRKLLTSFIPIFVGSIMYAQVGINTTSPNGATVLDITSAQKGILIPVFQMRNEMQTLLIMMQLLYHP